MTGLAGLAVAVLFGGGSALWAFDQTEAGASAGRVGSYYPDRHMIGPAVVMRAAISVQLLRTSGPGASP